MRTGITLNILALSLAAAALATGLMACQTTTSDDDIVTIDHQRLRALQAREDKRVVVVDVRSPAMFAQGHIPGAINIPLPELERRHPRLAEADRIVVYGRDRQSGLAAAAVKKLITLRYSDVYEFRGGLATWQAEGGELATSADSS